MLAAEKLITSTVISKAENGLINIVYWDYGFRTLRQLTPSFLKKITFGISHCTKKFTTAVQKDFFIIQLSDYLIPIIIKSFII